MQPPPTTSSLVSRKLGDFLVREAHLQLSRSQLAPALAAQQQEVQRVIESRPTLFSFQSKEKRAAYEAQVAEAKETLKMLSDGVAQLDRVEPHLRRMLREEIEDLLRAACPEYVQAIAARQQKDDWQRCIQRFAQRVYEFLQAIGSARNMACTGYTSSRQMFSQVAVQGFVLAIGCAEKVEAEVSFANRIAELQQKMFRESGLSAPPLPKLPITTYAVWVSSLSARSLAEAQIQFDALIAEVRQLYETAIPRLLAEGEAADHEHSSLIENFLETAWAQLREEVAPRIIPSETEANVASTERMLIELAKSTVHGRLMESGATRPPMAKV